MPKNAFSLADAERAVKAMARVALENEKYFCELDGELGDADFGTSLATGFSAILAEFDTIDRSDIGAFLVKVGMIFSAKVGGTSGPVWGTAFLRAGMTSRTKREIGLADLAAMGNNAAQGIMARGGAAQGDKTILDALIPAVNRIAEHAQNGTGDVAHACRDAAEAAQAAVEGTRQWPAKRGRQSYASERSVGTLDPGIVAVALMARAIVEQMEPGVGEGRVKA
jgi:phosphoenolpyruvate---glycerone phosphotransferase subunit DhaL